MEDSKEIDSVSYCDLPTEEQIIRFRKTVERMQPERFQKQFFTSNHEENNWVKDLLKDKLEGMEVYFINDKGQVVGQKTPRTPRKLKKKLKKQGKYDSQKITGFSMNSFFGIDYGIL